ncbi:hypothetical protein E4U46_001332 [Claviceps purpurea]|nr:hypothetical protein E4U46_001332 [Claviceps purpurea]
MALERPAATYVDSSENLRHIVRLRAAVEIVKQASTSRVSRVKTDLGSYPLELRPAAESRNQYVNVLSRCLGETPGHYL